MFTIGDAKAHFMDWLGEPSNDFRNAISFLKIRTLLTQIGDCKVTNRSIMAAIRELNEDAGTHLGAFPDVFHFKSRDPNEIPGVHHCCENPDLSIERIGMWIKAIDLKGKLLESINERKLTHFLYFAAGFVNLGESTDADIKNLGEAHAKARLMLLNHPDRTTTFLSLKDKVTKAGVRVDMLMGHIPPPLQEPLPPPRHVRTYAPLG